jgi:hypothetical protein
MADNEDCSLQLKEVPFPVSTIENIDMSMLKFLRDEMNLFSTTNKGWRRIPIMWASSERGFQSKRGEEIRDKQGTLILPMITVERTGVAKDPTRKGTVWGNVPPIDDEKGGSIPIARTLNQVKTSNFANADMEHKRGQLNFPRPNQKIVYSTVSIPIPVYVTVTYDIAIRTEYQQQMNELMVPFVTRPGGVNYILLSSNSHRYEGFIQQDFSHGNNLSDYSNDERKFETKIQIEVLGYLIGDDKNQIKPKFVYRENAVEVKIPRERVMLGEIPEHELGSYYGLTGVTTSKSQPPCSTRAFFSTLGAAGTHNLTGGTSSTTITTDSFKTLFVDSYAIGEYPTGATDCSNRVFTTQHNIKENTETLFFNGMLLYPGSIAAGADYEVSNGNTFTLHEDYTPQTSACKDAGEDVPDDIMRITYIRA